MFNAVSCLTVWESHFLRWITAFILFTLRLFAGCVTLLKGAAAASLTLHPLLFPCDLFFPESAAAAMEEFEEKTPKPFPLCNTECEEIAFFTRLFAISCEECKSLVCVFQGWKTGALPLAVPPDWRLTAAATLPSPPALDLHIRYTMDSSIISLPGKAVYFLPHNCEVASTHQSPNPKHSSWKKEEHILLLLDLHLHSIQVLDIEIYMQI